MSDTHNSYKYEQIFDPEANNSPAKIALRIAHGSTVLDLGAGACALGRYLVKDKQCILDGVDIDPYFSIRAASSYRCCQIADLQTIHLSELFPVQTYDYIVCADILEHLNNPAALLSQLPDLLAPEGHILISVPNVAYSGLIAELMAGHFEYRKVGLLDETHVRFFTRDSLEKLLRESGFKPSFFDRVDLDPCQSEFKVFLEQLSGPCRKQLLLSPDALTYQYVIEADVVTQNAAAENAIWPESRWAFSLQLFWRCENELFSQENSTLALGEIGVGRQHIQFLIPPQSAITALRFDPADRQGIISLHRMMLRNSEGNTIWQWEGRQGEWDETHMQQILPAWENKSTRTLILSCGNDPSWELPIAPDILAGLSDGGVFNVEISWPVSSDFQLLTKQVTALKQAYDERIADTLKNVQRLEQERNNLEQERNNLKLHCSLLSSELSALKSSTSWQLTAPLRFCSSGLRSFVANHPVLRFWLRCCRSFVFDQISAGKPGSSDKSSIKQLSVDSLEHHREKFRREACQGLDMFLAKKRTLSIPLSDQPVVSIIIVLYNQAELTLRCLTSLASESQVAFETIIVDNGSTDQTAQMMELISGADYIVNQDNPGFLKAVNQAAQNAGGSYLLFLNNDTQMLSGSLKAAVDRIYQNDKIGAVGGPIVLPDGTLQEAGSIIWRDGTCLGYGRGDNPDQPQYRFVRPVDYCSGAFLLIRRDLFEKLGGFDEIFAPAYYEETDLCARIWEQRLSVVYEPAARIVHYEFGSSASRERALKLQQRNRKIFVNRHRSFLDGRFPASAQHALLARSHDEDPIRILVIDDRVPHSFLGTGYPRAASIVKEMVRQGWSVTYYPLIIPRDDWKQCYQTLPDTVEIMLDYGEEKLKKFLKSRYGYYNTVWISRPHNMEIVRSKLGNDWGLLGGAQLVYDAEAVSALREIKKHKVLGKPMTAEQEQKQLRAELKLAEEVDSVVTVSQSEAEYFKQVCSNVQVLPHALMPSKCIDPFSSRNGILFVGALTDEDSPNVDGIVWFVESVWPLVQATLPDVVLYLAGNCTSKRVMALASRDIRILGCVGDLSARYSQARVFIAPTRFAAGIPHKVHEAAAHGLPVVATRLLVEQLGWMHGEELLSAETPEDFAEQLTALYNSESLWQKLSDAATEAIKRDCSQQNFASVMGQVIAHR
ncbi:MAG: glycosyltransferase [Desulfobacterales bacterium]|nr:glycosyltransferase [Desulfobacterales bacterium]MDD4073301.1 glycosyltransferase [Desulfobacterales bacterium]MDD4393506.1 glycosyltransferase [Desulfobacterales bacterium]